MVAGTASVEVAARAGQERSQQKWLLAPHQWKLLPKSQDPEADGGLKNSSALVDPEAPPSTVGCGRHQIYRLRRRDLHKVGAKAACVDAAAAYVDVAGLRAWTWPGSPSQKVAGPDEGQVDPMRLELHKVGARSRV